MKLVQWTLSEEAEVHRDGAWHRELEERINNVYSAERFIDSVGFCSALTDSRRPGPSLYIAVCGRRDAHTPRNLQKDPETSLGWTIKDELIRRGHVFYGKLKKTRAIFITRRLIPHFNALFGIARKQERSLLSKPAQNILTALRKEWNLQQGSFARKAALLKERSSTRQWMSFRKTLG